MSLVDFFIGFAFEWLALFYPVFCVFVAAAILYKIFR